ncbi:transporter [Solilutibacter silvestris]|uniref:Putative MetA-pathway of phenol degradation protein n=1 Tax=Solilutibacter silvestris TaxID=1645665 RepID=A0A2K1Q322_9GAMM|nr:transporter [Lysobacter silvestris]PNS09440.1 putative MetA-pathway of phenol degradation protein [Lysobacter silvestris]
MPRFIDRFDRRRVFRLSLLAASLCGSAITGHAFAAETSSPPQQSLDDAWWTGSVIANSPAPLPKGHGYVESYFYDAKSPGVDAWGSQTYMLYGLSDRVTVGVRPLFGYTRIDGGGGSTHIGGGDIALHAQYALTTYSREKNRPALAVAIEESLPTGRYDRLDRASNGFGSGARTTTLGIYAQHYFWMPNGRILRGRVNISGSHSDRAHVRDLSVYGTSVGFAGDARPGNSVAFDNAWEYSITRNWVLATDFYYRHDAATILRDASGVRSRSHASDTFAVVPAIEYNWTPRVGVIFGTRYIPARGHNTRSLTPVVALSVFM